MKVAESICHASLKHGNKKVTWGKDDISLANNRIGCISYISNMHLCVGYKDA